MSDDKHEGSCHCGRVRYRVSLDLSKPAVICNCSMCGRMGSMLAFVPDSSFELVSGEDALTDYLFAKKEIHHLFCKTCGIRSFARSEAKGMVAVNLRCVEGLDPLEIETTFVDGKSF